MIRAHIVRAASAPTLRPAWAAGIRAAVATIGPMVAGDLLHSPEAGMWMGLAGFNVTLGDKGGALGMRFRAMLASLVAGTLAAGIGGLAGRTEWSAVLFVALFAFVAGGARAWGQIATSAGIVMVATYVISIAYPAPKLENVAIRTGAAIAGGAFAMALALVVWRTRPYRAARIAVARAYRALAARSPEAPQAFEEARMALAAVRRGLQGELPRGERLLILVETAERIQDGDPRILEAIADAVEREDNTALEGIAARGPLDTALAAARELNGAAQVKNGQPTLFEPLAGHLAWSSAILRHALRVAIATAAAVALTELLGIERGYWVTFSVIVILQPYTSLTFQKGLQRVAGTIAGGLIAAAILALVHSRIELLAIIFVGAAFTVALLPVNYTLYSLFLTPTFVLLAEMNASDWHLIWLRVGNTMAGAAIAYAAAWLLWPASERGLVREDLTIALRELGTYARCIGECDDVRAKESRRAFLVALQNADASLQRVIGDAKPDAEPLMAILVYARRFAVALSALANTPDRFLLFPLMTYTAGRLDELSSALAASRAPFPADAPPDAAGAERLLEPLAAMERAVARLAA